MQQFKDNRRRLLWQIWSRNSYDESTGRANAPPAREEAFSFTKSPLESNIDSPDTKNESKMKHLTLKDREIIEQMLRSLKSFSAIIERLGKSKSTISREIRKCSIRSDKSAPHRIANCCKFRYECHKHYICTDELYARSCSAKQCRYFKRCNSHIVKIIRKKHVSGSWSLLMSVTLVQWKPSVCCGKKYNIAKIVEKQYRFALVESRSGANISESEMMAFDKFVMPSIREGQSIRHIPASNPDSFSICGKVLYRPISARMIVAWKFDMPRIIWMKPRKQKSLVHKIDKKCKIGRTYSDFLQFIPDNSRLPVVEMDTVIGDMGGKVLLTISFHTPFLFPAYLQNRNASQSVIDIFEQLYADLGKDIFCRLSPVILTDNGSQFSNPSALEFDRDEEPTYTDFLLWFQHRISKARRWSCPWFCPSYYSQRTFLWFAYLDWCPTHGESHQFV